MYTWCVYMVCIAFLRGFSKYAAHTAPIEPTSGAQDSCEMGLYSPLRTAPCYLEFGEVELSATYIYGGGVQLGFEQSKVKGPE